MIDESLNYSQKYNIIGININIIKHNDTHWVITICNIVYELKHFNL